MIQNIPYCQALRVRRICSEEKDYHESLKQLKSKFMKRGYPPYVVDNQFNKLKDLQRKDLLQYKDKNPTFKIHFSVTYNKTLPNIKETINNNWNLLKIDSKIANAFDEKPVISFKRNPNLRDLIGGTNLINNKKILRKKNTKGNCRPCFSKTGNLCCKQVLTTNTFTSETTNRTFSLRHYVTCRSKNIIYLGGCILCPKHQYTGKSETPFNNRLNNHRLDAKKPTSIPFDEHFLLPGHDFTKHARFIIIEQLKVHKDKLVNRRILKEREDFWIEKLKTVAPYGMNIHTTHLFVIKPFKFAHQTFNNSAISANWVHQT